MLAADVANGPKPTLSRALGERPSESAGVATELLCTVAGVDKFGRPRSRALERQPDGRQPRTQRSAEQIEARRPSQDALVGQFPQNP